MWFIAEIRATVSLSGIDILQVIVRIDSFNVSLVVSWNTNYGIYCA